MNSLESKNKNNNRILITLLWVIIPVAVFLATLCLGRFSISLSNVFKTLLSVFAGEADPGQKLVVINTRLPRALVSFIVGAGLSVAGCCFQSIFSNPLASPDTLGVSSGAAFGSALGILLSLGTVGTETSALLFGIAAIAATFALSRARSGNEILMIVLGGVITTAFFNALVSLIKYVADPLTKLPEITYWLMGSMLGSSYADLMIVGPLVCFPLLVIMLLRWRLNILMLPEEEIVSLGINAKRMRWIVILMCTLIVASCVSVCGQIGWVGLVIPHMAKRIVGTNHVKAIPACISLGGTYLLIIDTVARTATSGEIPLSILTAIIGVPLFVFLFFRKEKESLAS